MSGKGIDLSSLIRKFIYAALDDLENHIDIKYDKNTYHSYRTFVNSKSGYKNIFSCAKTTNASLDKLLFIYSWNLSGETDNYFNLLYYLDNLYQEEANFGDKLNEVSDEQNNICGCLSVHRKKIEHEDILKYSDMFVFLLKKIAHNFAVHLLYKKNNFNQDILITLLFSVLRISISDSRKFYNILTIEDFYGEDSSSSEEESEESDSENAEENEKESDEDSDLEGTLNDTEEVKNDTEELDTDLTKYYKQSDNPDLQISSESDEDS